LVHERQDTIRRRAAEQDRLDVAEARAAWRASQPTLDPGRLIFADETWTKTNMVRLYGRCERGPAAG